MKQLFAFSILFCLVFLNVPRSFVHNCNHEGHNIDVKDHQHNSDNQVTSLDVDQGACFICEFDLGFFNVSESKNPAFAKFFDYTFNKPSVECLSPDEFSAFSHRGPPNA